jgi:quaternary ammonium compound-resistance protein SugE
MFQGRPCTEGPIMNWILLLLAGLLEVVWAVGLKHTEGFTRLWPSLFTLAAMGGSFFLLSMAMRSLPLGTAYAVWVGVGAVGAVIAGAVMFGESMPPLKVVSVVLVVAGIAGLKLAS